MGAPLSAGAVLSRDRELPRSRPESRSSANHRGFLWLCNSLTYRNSSVPVLARTICPIAQFSSFDQRNRSGIVASTTCRNDSWGNAACHLTLIVFDLGFPFAPCLSASSPFSIVRSVRSSCLSPRCSRKLHSRSASNCSREYVSTPFVDLLPRP